MDKFGKVAVLYGGDNSEREVSLVTGKAVCDALLALGVDAHLVDPKEGLIEQLVQQSFDRVFIALHGFGVEDGGVQGCLDVMGLPYTGCGVDASAITFNKIAFSAMMKAEGLPVPALRVVDSLQACLTAVEAFDFPVAIKPANEGSSVGVSKVKSVSEVAAAFELASACHGRVMVEPWIEGRELTLAVFEGEAYPLIEIKTPREFYDYEAKYKVDTTEYLPVTNLPPELVDNINELALTACHITGCQGCVRVDVLLDQAQTPYLLEINTMPGLTPRSLVPKSVALKGLDFDSLIVKMLSQTLDD